MIDGDPEIPEPPLEAAAPVDTPPIPAPPRSPVWGYADLLIVLGLLTAGFGIALITAGIMTFVADVKDPHLLALPAEFAGYALSFALIAIHLRTRYSLPFWRGLGWHWQPQYVMPALVAGVALAITVGLTGYVLNTPPVKEGLIQELLRNPVTRVMVIISATTIGPVAEELLFRGFLLPLLARTFGTAIGVMLAAVPFALLHGPQYKWTWQLVLLIFVAGCAFGWTRVRTGSTATSTVIHSAYNSVFFLTYFAQKGMEV